MNTHVEIERFTRDLMNDEALREGVRSLAADRREVVRYANAKGYDFSVDDLSGLPADVELSDAQLDGASGGLDDAFMRRIALVVSDPLPTSEDRLKVWAGLFPRT